MNSVSKVGGQPVEEERGTAAKAGATSGLPGWELLFSSCEEGCAVILLPAQEIKILGKDIGLYSTQTNLM